MSVGQTEHQQIFPRAGWVEHDPNEIWNNTREVVGLALTRANKTYSDVAAIGITNQRETAVVWDRTTGQPVYNAIVWQDTRTQKICDDLAALGGGASATRTGSACRWRPTSPARRSAGSSTTSRARGRRRSAASWRSATPTPGCCGT